MSYKKLGLKCGIEIHQQLDGRKLFSHALTTIRDTPHSFTITRKLRAVAGESGKTDVAAAQEQQKDVTYVYQGDEQDTLVETDSEPPRPICMHALGSALQFSQLVNADITPIIQVMRKTVVDGSNTSGFQRTALVARNGVLATSEGKVRITNVSLEEDSCRIITKGARERVYRLDRLGIPLIEIGTAPDIVSPEHCKETAEKLGMYLRSLSNCKRGLGTIRQDVNISIAGGNRIEIKGAQDLRQIPLLVDLEVKRQVALLKLQKDLPKLGSFTVVEVSKLFTKTKAKRIQSALKSGKVLGLKVTGFAGILGRELQPNYRVGSELAGRAKIIAGVGGIFHSDELPAYGITAAEVKTVRAQLGCKREDAFILVADEYVIAQRALEAVWARIEELYKHVPMEVRQAQPDGTTRYLRPIPGAARMYPETDVPLIYADLNIALPELLDAKIERFIAIHKLTDDLASHVVKSGYAGLFETIVAKHPKIKKAFVAETLTATLTEIKRKYQAPVENLSDAMLEELFDYLAEDKIHKDIVLDVLIDMSKGAFDLAKYASVGTEQIHSVIADVVKANKGAPFGALMGKCMAKLQGKASGQVIAVELKKIMAMGHK